MANVSHASLTGSEVHEPKGITGAALGTVYVSNGAGSGSWSSIGTSAFTGMVADFISPVAPAGWLELDGSIISTTTYSALYGAMSITTSGTRTNGSPTLTSIPDTSNFRVGYYIFGTGIASGTTILSVDSASQITLSANASSSGSSAVAVSPWLMNTGTIKLPDLSSTGRYRRSRSYGTKVGDIQASQNISHSHSVSATTGINSVDHSHTFSGSTGNDTPDHTHSYLGASTTGNTGGGGAFGNNQFSGSTSGASTRHTHPFSGTTSGISSNHTHSFTTTSAADGASEARPITMVFITCVKT